MYKKNIVIGVTGGIAVYKAVDVVSKLTKKNYNVHVIMTKAAQKFVSPLTFQSISMNYVVSDMFNEPKNWEVEHIALAQKADLFIIVPATANIIGKIANGIADDMLSTTVMATNAPVLITPAMNTNMLCHPIVQENIMKLMNLGYHFVEPAEGRLACGDFGKGKLADPEVIVLEAERILNLENDLAGKRILVTAGPTREPIDPVRYLTNYSSGKMGYAVAEVSAKRGAEVILISGPTALKKPMGVTNIDVITTNDMYEAVLKNYEWADIIVKAAAVSDYRPESIANDKIKKLNEEMSIKLTKNPDILKELGTRKKKNQILIGFAAETQDLIKNARLKIENKNLDFIVANDVTKDGAGFDSDTNIAAIIDKNESIQYFDKMSKLELADIIITKAQQMME